MNKYFILVILSLFLGCGETWEDPDKHVYIDFKDQANDDQQLDDTTNYIKVAIASMVSPQETFFQYNRMLSYIEEKLDRKVSLVQRKTYKEVNELLRKGEIDVGFICSGAYVAGAKDSAFNLLVIPQMNGKRHYYAYLIVNKNSDYRSFRDLRGKRFVFTDSLSNTGMYYPLKRLNDYNSTIKDFFASTYLSNAHDYSIELVSRNIVEGASVNSLIFEYIQRMTPEKVLNVKVIERSEPYGMPPVVTSRQIDEELRKQLENIFLDMANEKSGKDILGGLMIDKFVKESDTLYNDIRRMSKEIL
jgi:phosphonate transport system substrate-binding protein